MLSLVAYCHRGSQCNMRCGYSDYDLMDMTMCRLAVLVRLAAIPQTLQGQICTEIEQAPGIAGHTGIGPGQPLLTSLFKKG
jgi:hypothetical protein